MILPACRAALTKFWTHESGSRCRVLQSQKSSKITVKPWRKISDNLALRSGVTTDATTSWANCVDCQEVYAAWRVCSRSRVLEFRFLGKKSAPLSKFIWVLRFGFFQRSGVKFYRCGIRPFGFKILKPASAWNWH